MSSDLVYQNRAEYNSIVGTLILTRSEIRFVSVSNSGSNNIIFSSQIHNTEAKVEGMIFKKLTILDLATAKNHSVKTTNPEIWIKKINTTKLEA
jgi:hypothetical protein